MAATLGRGHLSKILVLRRRQPCEAGGAFLGKQQDKSSLPEIGSSWCVSKGRKQKVHLELSACKEEAGQRELLSTLHTSVKAPGANILNQRHPDFTPSLPI